ncbi:hypothetical protein KDL45_17530, partial [bacterium]|nr:hypothetical protein [bacterium]
MLPRNAKIIAAYIQQVVSANLDRRNGLVRDWGTLEEEPYPCVRTTAEAISTALYYEKLHGRKELLNLARKLAKPVLRAMEIHGGAGWDGTIYLFDTQIALMALWRLIERTQEFAAWKGYFDVSDQSRLMAAQLTATHGAAVPDHWTARTSPHLLKIYPLLPNSEGDALRRLMEMPSFTSAVNGRNSNSPYPTAQVCHALEGLLVMPDGE